MSSIVCMKAVKNYTKTMHLELSKSNAHGALNLVQGILTAPSDQNPKASTSAIFLSGSLVLFQTTKSEDLYSTFQFCNFYFENRFGLRIHYKMEQPNQKSSNDNSHKRFGQSSPATNTVFPQVVLHSNAHSYVANNAYFTPS